MNITREMIEAIAKEAQTFFVNASGCHDWSHVERVKQMALKIGEQEGADLALLEVAVLLHDIGRRDEMLVKGSFCHAERGAELAPAILRKHNFDQADIDNIIHCILAHRFRNSHIPESIEAKVLYDADKLDSIGAMGIARAFLFAGHSGSNTLYTGHEKERALDGNEYNYSKEDSALLEYEVKLKKVKDKMLTTSGKKIAVDRHNLMVNFFNTFQQEIIGEC